jgi:hypothetical protein
MGQSEDWTDRVHRKETKCAKSTSPSLRCVGVSGGRGSSCVGERRNVEIVAGRGLWGRCWVIVGFVWKRGRKRNKGEDVLGIEVVRATEGGRGGLDEMRRGGQGRG